MSPIAILFILLFLVFVVGVNGWEFYRRWQEGRSVWSLDVVRQPAQGDPRIFIAKNLVILAACIILVMVGMVAIGLWYGFMPRLGDW